ncbi:exodeoxyribonuclease VII large subunit [Jeotgalibacillus alimentarius]|uniref:Exodeoxyribonuclease 7 large subunit n=1 Tax=Jeotgalibacillus alimentarius TaxID=135826 RepID=A0A0C2S3S1_9BACL|nr:exodeoxyribonuclease VII large subunit [Jeotgalibacillus alimentarius]KIL48614.1 exodeoxyribonuclease VII large subunit [Jeotgalibacillus alimentarius]
MSEVRYLTVSALTKYIKRKFDADPHLSNVLIKGEISNLKQPGSGHLYFTLKDQKTRISAVMFSSAAGSLKFQPENGMEILLSADVSVFEASGQYQLYVKKMEPDGVGALYLAYEQLKEKLSKEGLFDQSKKRSLPAFPEHIGVITSATGAVIKDILTTAQRRYPIASIRLYPCSVQGEKAVPSILASLKEAGEDQLLDVLIIGRGGGSIEELWAFNDEQVAREIAAFPVPVISAVGHETDVTIADFAADLRAPTPTAAAEMAVPHIEEVLERIMRLEVRSHRAVNQLIEFQKQKLKQNTDSMVFKKPQKLVEPHAQYLDRLDERLNRESAAVIQQAAIKRERLQERLFRLNPASQIERKKNSLHRLTERLANTTTKKVNMNKQRFIQASASLEALSPLKIMNRGYSLIYDDSNELIKTGRHVKPGDKITVSMQTADLHCTVNQKMERETDGKE